ncbi:MULTISPECIES: Hsp33 family molecular chaperone HslO [unclassified Duganella]|uniref:Hsp33 family molecular chaperone HslO n=1 Tax=unclassified Duganella TaxID=2636909 RepID=UPI00087402C5|nr:MULTISPECIES: Hsp33 family molecular chaperone HslO [unclassified Duganella]OEZ63379.1 33 kDa chaperonin [Duganella sp. HH105]OFA02885.1 33 kDa chaperonin [Duganella sp. HH101]OFA02990.1 33 kDa chaperonin [Duganella sp. HH101]
MSITPIIGQDTLQKFIFDNAAVRGEFIDISATWREVLSRHAYPAPVKKLLGEMVAAAALLSANLKFNGTIIMQIHGDGPLRLLVVECDADLNLRATAKLDPDAAIADDATLQALLNEHGKGRFIITLDPADKMPGQQPYQGIVPLDGDDVSTVIENYMLRSEQLDTKLWLAADDNVSRGLLLQKLPYNGGTTAAEATPLTEDDALETWNRAVILGSTLKQEEILSTTIDVLMERLFWEETIRVFEPLHPAFHCTCTREKVGNMLKMLGRAEVDSVLEEQGHVGVNCDFCGQHYDYDKVDCAQLFATDAPVEALIPAGEVKH